ncbi:hypothetical protein OEA41_003222 [Lepraria neglecta]|uniref:DUF974 domain-containing protein n=1 Tax=Lepraria neglecta TaxID=209136 RepID=A0AAD9Z5L4_9LECA|nr:hypothetical protein OEA41_003222 [Lepraria neglecta]
MEQPKEPHSVSLKGADFYTDLLNHQFPLPLPPKSSASYINPGTALDHKPGENDDEFIFDPVLTLPPSFGSAYVGETFSCTLCANNELLADADRLVSSVKIEAEMQAPSGTNPLQLMQADDDSPNPQVKPGESLQKIVQFDLREEGSHTLAVNLSYSETTISKDQAASSGRVRTFRKLYQFVARSCLSVRTKVSSAPSADSEDRQKYIIEVQLENMADGTITLKTVTFNTKPTFKSTSLNWDAVQSDMQHTSSPVMAPRDVIQIAFLVDQRTDGPDKEVTKDGRIILGQLSIQWRTEMGDSGFLSTGWLTTKRR